SFCKSDKNGCSKNRWFIRPKHERKPVIAIIRYNAGNSRSVKNALDRLGCESIITGNIQEIKKADRVIFPGVGEAKSAMAHLEREGLDRCKLKLKQPFLGIGLGMQLMCTYSEEHGTDCLGIFKTEVKQFPSDKIIPQMGWNNFERVESELLKGINTNDHVYFANSYYAEVCQHTIAECEYGVPFSAAIGRDNF